MGWQRPRRRGCGRPPSPPRRASGDQPEFSCEAARNAADARVGEGGAVRHRARRNRRRRFLLRGDRRGGLIVTIWNGSCCTLPASRRHLTPGRKEKPANAQGPWSTARAMTVVGLLVGALGIAFLWAAGVR